MKNAIAIIFTLFMCNIIPSIAQKKALFIQWEKIAELPIQNGELKALGVAGGIVGVSLNKLIVAGGANFPEAMPWDGGAKKYHNTLYVFEKLENKIVQLQKQFQLPYNLAYAACVSTPLGIVAIGGENENGYSKKVLLIQWNTNDAKPIVQELPELPAPLASASVVAFKNTLYVAGGENTSGTLDLFFMLDLQNPNAGWKSLPALPQPTSHAVIALQANNDTTLLLIGGRKKNTNAISTFYNTVFAFDFILQQWKPLSPLPYPLAAGTGIALNRFEILLFGGDKATVFHKVETLILAINAENDANKKMKLIQEKNAIQAAHQGFSKDVLLYNFQKDAWQVIDFLPFPTPVTTTAVKWGSQIILPSGEIKAGVRTPDIFALTIQKAPK
jgi:N-acetylneuraminic acid mutarotase